MKHLDKGTEVTINAQGINVTGEVISAQHYGDEGWYIELLDTKGNYRYWKERYDGGHLTHIEGENVCPHKFNKYLKRCTICQKEQ